MTRLTLDQAAKLTWQLVSLEHNPLADHGLSADIVAETEDGEPIVSVIHIEDRRHWNLVIMTDLDHKNPPAAPRPCVTVKDYNLADTLLSDDQGRVPGLPGVFYHVTDGTQLHVFGIDGDEWLILVSVLDPAKV